MEHITSKDGTVIGFQRAGTGRPLLLVHGTTADHRRWDSVSSTFEQQFTVYAIDRRGRGASGDAPDYDLMREAEDVAGLVEAIGEPTFILGHSYGGLCGLEAALLTDKVSKLILYEPDAPTGVSPIPQNILDRVQALLDKGELEAALEVVFREIVEMPEDELAAYRQLPMWKGRIQLAPTIPREVDIYRTYSFNAERFASLQVSTMLLLGGDSPPFARQSIELVDAALPNSRVVILPGEQHIAMDTNPELFVREVLRLLLE